MSIFLGILAGGLIVAGVGYWLLVKLVRHMWK